MKKKTQKKAVLATKKKEHKRRRRVRSEPTGEPSLSQRKPPGG